METFCVSTAISWALVFSDPLGVSNAMIPRSMSCFSSEAGCSTAAMAANDAFQMTFSRHRATCEWQPAGDPTKPIR